MKDIFSIFVNDLKSIGRNLVVFVVVIGITILPALYAWFNIAANWDPYSNTGGIQFAVCSEDLGYTYSVLSINAGDQMIENLEKNDKMGWTFVEKEEALEGVEKGRYYAAVIIPEDFSENLFSVLTGKFKQAEIHYYVNNKKNAIAPKITDKGVQTIQENINSTYVGTIAKVLASVLKLTSSSVNMSEEEIMDKALNYLEAMKLKVEGMRSVIDKIKSTLDKMDSTIKSNKEILPKIQEALEKSSVKVEDVKDSVSSTKNITANMSGTIEALIDSAESMASSVSDQIADAINKVQSGSSDAASKLRSITVVNEKIIEIDDKLISILKNIENSLGVDCQKLIDSIQMVTDKQTAIRDLVSQAAQKIETTGTLPDQMMKNLQQAMYYANQGLNSVSTTFAGVKGSIDSAIDGLVASFESVSDFLQNLGQRVPDYGSVFDNASNSVQDLKKSVDEFNKYIDNAKVLIDNLITKVKDLKDGDNLSSMITPVIKNPEALGEFISSPASIKSNELFGLENYGSGMTPFYSTLALWVGGIVLVAVTRTDLKKHEMRRLNNANPTKMFFGRYLLFFMLGQIQALIISLGDLFFLKIQCDNPFLFVAASMISSFVYTLIIYSLTITFSVIGKALAVIILVIQIAGSGGTFPIEVLPDAFKTLSPYLPFKYGIDALREAVAGVDTSVFWQNILTLLIFVPISLILGLLLRKPCIRVINFLNERIEQSDVII